MNETTPDRLTVLPDPQMFRAARWAGRVCLGIAAIGIVAGLAPLLGIWTGSSGVAVARGGAPLMITALCCGVSLLASGPNQRGVAAAYVERIANVLALFAASVVVFWMRVGSSEPHARSIVFPPAAIGFGYVLLAIAVILLDKRGWFVNRVVDVLACGLSLLLLLIVSGVVFDVLRRSGHMSGWRQAPAVVCLGALIVALTLRQAEHGVLSIFLGVGTGSRLVRIFAPILLVFLFGWEAAVAQLNQNAPMSHTRAGVLAAAAVAVGVGMLLFFAWRMSRMENQIHDLILRDEATRLYNHRGFHMLAEHALRLAERSSIPFSVLFIHMENLAHIHAEMGSEASSTALAEAGEILRATFRESDIKGRIGADEFAVAGQFDRAGISIAAMRLESAAAARLTKRQAPVPLKFSMGYVTTSETIAAESLKEMLVRAGQMRHQQTAQLREMRVN